MLPQAPIPRLSPQGPPRTLAKPPKAPLRGQAPSGAPAPAQDAQIKAVAMQQAQQQPERYQAPAQKAPMAPARAPAPMAVQQQIPGRAPVPMQQAPQMDPRAQAIAAMKAQTGGDYPNPQWQPKPAYLTTGEAYTPAPVGGVVPATVAPAPVRYNAPMPNAPVVDMGISALNSTPVRGAPSVFTPTTPVGMNPNYDPGAPHTNLTPVSGNPRYNPNAPHAGTPDPSIGPDGQTIEPRPMAPANTTPVRTGEPTGPNPTDDFDWEALADKLGIGGLQDQVKETTAKEALGAMTSDLSEFGFNPEELAAQEAQIIRQAAEAKAKAMQQMAGRGLGGSGLELAGLGNIDVGAISAITDLQTENKALQIEQRLNEIKTYLSAYGSQLDDETRKELAAEAADLQKEMFEYDKTSQKEADRHTALNNMLAQIGAKQWDPEALAWAYDQLDAGASYADVLRDLSKTLSSEAFVPDSVLAQATAKDNEEQGQGTPQGTPSLTPSGEYAPAEPVWYEDPSQIPVLYAAYVDEANAAGATPMSQGEWLQWNLLNMTPEVKSQYGVST